MSASSTMDNSPINAGGNVGIHTTTTIGTQINNRSQVVDPLDVLRNHAALGALDNARERPSPPRCHPETRKAVLQCIDDWAQDRSVEARPILWLTGAAGAGKSAIAQTLVEGWKRKGYLIPNFFFWRTSPTRNHNTHLIPTIVYQLAEHLFSTLEIEKAIKGGIFEKNLTAQADQLISTSLGDVSVCDRRIIIVIDGLDECCTNLPKAEGFPGQSADEQQRDVLEAIAHICKQASNLRVLIASRPERQIRRSFDEEPLSALSHPVSLNDDADAAKDIAVYLDCAFAEIRRRHEIPKPWPSNEQIQKLVEKASGQFIYPSIVVKYVGHPQTKPRKRLAEVLELQSTSRNGEEHPLADLDALYTLILGSVHKDALHTVKIILGSLCYLDKDLPILFTDLQPGHYPSYLERVLQLEAGELFSDLVDLHSILHIPKRKDSAASSIVNEPIRFLHATISEYLQDRSRSQKHFIGKNDAYHRFSLLMVEHAKLEQEALQHSDPLHYAPLSVLTSLARLIQFSPPSPKLMTSLWDLFKEDIGDYSLLINPNPKAPANPSGNTDIKREMPNLRFHRLGLKSKLAILKYLRICNNAKMEPSEVHRNVIDRHLAQAILQIDLHDPVAQECINRVSHFDDKENEGQPREEIRLRKDRQLKHGSRFRKGYDFLFRALR